MARDVEKMYRRSRVCVYVYIYIYLYGTSVSFLFVMNFIQSKAYAYFT